MAATLDTKSTGRSKLRWLLLGSAAAFLFLLIGSAAVAITLWYSQRPIKGTFTVAELCREVDERLQGNDLHVMEYRTITLTGKVSRIEEQGIDGTYVFVMTVEGGAEDIHAIHVFTGHRPQPRLSQTARVVGSFNYNHRLARIEIQSARILELIRNGQEPERLNAAPPSSEPPPGPPPPFKPKIYTTKELVDTIQQDRRQNREIALAGKNIVVTGTVAFASDPDDEEGLATVAIDQDGKLGASDTVLLLTGQLALPKKGQRIEATGTCFYDTKMATPVLRDARITAPGGRTLPPPPRPIETKIFTASELETLVEEHRKTRTLHELEGLPVIVRGKVCYHYSRELSISSNGLPTDSDCVIAHLRDTPSRRFEEGELLSIRGDLHIERKLKVAHLKNCPLPLSAGEKKR